jgi:hypothetical protein
VPKQQKPHSSVLASSTTNQNNMNGEKLLPPGEFAAQDPLPGVPSAKQQSWGVVISIVVIVLMIVIGAFYAWGKRIEQNQNLVPITTGSPQN